MESAHPPAYAPVETVEPQLPGRQIRVVVLGVGWPMETFIARLLSGLAQSNLSITIMSHVRPPSEWLEQNRIEWMFGPGRLGVRDFGSQLRRNGLRSSLSTALGQAHRPPGRGASVRAGRRVDAFDVIYVPWINTLIDQSCLLAVSRPVVTSCRGALVTIAPWNPDRRAHREALPAVFERSTLVHCVSDAIVQNAVEMGLDPAKARVISPAVDPDHFRPLAAVPPRSGPIRVLAVGTLNWRKDYQHALVAVRKALDMGADLRLDIIGDGDDRQHLLFTIDDLDLQGRVRLLGRLEPDEVRRHLGEAEIFVHTSSSEGISNAVLEAMSTALAVVTTDSGGMREAVRDGIDGIVVGIRDVDATAEALVRLASDDALRARLGASARQRILDRFRLDQQVAAFAALLHEAVAR